MPTYILTYRDGGSASIKARNAEEARITACKELAYIGFIDEGRLTTADGRRSWDLWFEYGGDRGGIYDWMYSEGDGPAKHVRPYTRPKTGTLGADEWQGLWLMDDGSIANALWGDTDEETTLYALGTVCGDVFEPEGCSDIDMFFPFDEVDTIDNVYCDAVMDRSFKRLLISVNSPNYDRALDLLEDGMTPKEVCKKLGIRMDGSKPSKPVSASHKSGPVKKRSTTKRTKGGKPAPRPSKSSGGRRR